MAMHFLIRFCCTRDSDNISEYNYQRSLHICTFIVVAADLAGTLKSAYKQNICYTYSLYKIIKPIA
jgi:hypothetical protein